jgi:hypothetical protein
MDSLIKRDSEIVLCYSGNILKLLINFMRLSESIVENEMVYFSYYIFCIKALKM